MIEGLATPFQQLTIRHKKTADCSQLLTVRNYLPLL
jgi:hypothetical protein